MFKALLDKCLEKDKFILCEILIRSNAAPRLAALIPQQEEKDDEVKHIQKCPAGFHLIYMPYADDFRQIDRKVEVKRKQSYSLKFFVLIRNKYTKLN